MLYIHVEINKYLITTYDGMDTGARATQEQLPVGRLSPCPLGFLFKVSGRKRPPHYDS